MKIYAIADEELNREIGVLLYFERERSCIIELRDSLDEWTAPLLFDKWVKEGIYTISREISHLWVMERVIPSGRQNIAGILTTHKMKEYDEFKFLEISNGRCCQDALYIRKIDVLPDYVKERMTRNLTEYVLTEDGNLLCFFEDDTMRKIRLSDIRHVNGVDKLLQNSLLLQSGRVGAGGYSLVFGEIIDIPAYVLYTSGEKIPLSLTDFMIFARNNLLDTSKSCQLLECSRQNLSYHLGKKLSPVKEGVKGNLYLKAYIERLKW